MGWASGKVLKKGTLTRGKFSILAMLKGPPSHVRSSNYCYNVANLEVKPANFEKQQQHETMQNTFFFNNVPCISITINQIENIFTT